MNKFEVKAYECELLGSIYESLQARKDFTTWDSEKCEWVPDTSEWALEHIAIIDDLMKKIEKLI